MLNKILIVDFGSQVTQLIARSVRSQKVYCEVIAYNFLSKKLIEKYGAKGKKIKILYGGSVSKKNAEDILSIDHVNGALIGGASLKYKDFKSILDFCD